ncbi:hypothetical protein TeGR_g4693 [Tetraparma gracilis]|uniref:SAM domain-containing protein n=1 Tax=Tetraparma gracilis TaxID=2962635 RepID=A0ABQ6M448_9STRA|nr:hypothetical protein TeGR_g4693 [Tetraparma gracilis]
MSGSSVRRISVVVEKAVGDIQTTVSKRQLILAIPLVVACAAWETNMFLNSAEEMRWVRTVQNTLLRVGSPLVLAGYAFPDFTYTTADKIVFALLAALNFVLQAAWDAEATGLVWLYMHFFVYGPRQEAHAPPTYMKYLIVPVYILAALQSVDKAVTGGKYGLALMGLGMLYSIPFACYLLAADKPLEKARRVVTVNGKDEKHEITCDGYYFVSYNWLIIGAGGGLGFVLVILGDAAAVVQSVGLQLTSLLVLRGAQSVGIRTTDTDRFAPLMLIVYFIVDLLQSFLYLKENMFGTDFFKMLAVQEAFSIAKNSGLFELIMWVVGARKTFPYGDPKTIRLLKSKAMVDSLSEVLAGFAACAIFAVETEIRRSSFVNAANITLVTGNETITYETTFCLATCIGWNYDDEPPLHEDDIMSRGNLVSLFAVLTAFRLLCLGIEVAALTKAQEKFNELTRSSSSGSSVTPVLGTAGATKPFAELTKEELRAWMVEAKFGSYAEGFDKIEAHMLVGVTEDDIKDFGNLPAVFRRNAASAAQEQASRMTDEAASVFTRVNTAFLVFSFVMALESVLTGLLYCAWLPTREGITVTINGEVVFEN